MIALERPSRVPLGISVCMRAFNEAENLGPAVNDAVRTALAAATEELIRLPAAEAWTGLRCREPRPAGLS